MKTSKQSTNEDNDWYNYKLKVCILMINKVSNNYKWKVKFGEYDILWIYNFI